MNKDDIINYIDNLNLNLDEKNELLKYAKSLFEKKEKLSENLLSLKNNPEFSKSIIGIIKSLTKEK